ncbi:MAG: AAA family ATPase [Candidatus Magasanikbacteria bacterium]|nr:AAA family ATPase [Candidatus Magasanikbacteria bacterium]
MQKIIIGIAGEMASGKTTITEYLKKKYNASTFRFSDILRDVLKRIWVEPNRSNLQDLSTFLRGRFGEDLLSKVLAKDVRESKAAFIITEGIRRPSDIVYLKKNKHFYLIALEADERTRFERISARSENPDDQNKTWKAFKKEGEQESEQKIRRVMKEADFTIDNNGNLKSLYEQTKKIVSSIMR